MTKAEVKEILEKQLQVLSEDSAMNHYGETPSAITHAMCELADRIISMGDGRCSDESEHRL